MTYKALATQLCDLILSRLQMKADRPFAVGAPRLQNDLPEETQPAESSLKSLLKTRFHFI